MRSNIAVYGSCIIKDPLTTAFNENYKEKYNSIIVDQRHSIISTMQEKIIVNDELLDINPVYPDSKFRTKCIKDDLYKQFLEDLKLNEVDYLIIDVHFEVFSGILYFNNGKILTNLAGIEDTKYFEHMNIENKINIRQNPNQYYNLWCKYCDKFFNYINTNYPNIKIILAEVRAIDKVQKEDKSVYIEEHFTKRVEELNPLYKLLEDYIKQNHEVYVIKFDDDILCDENHRWGKSYIHYTRNYYERFLNKLNQIVEYDQIKKDNELLLSKKNDLNRLKNENELLKNENIKLNKKIDEYHNSRSWKLTKPFRAIVKIFK